MSARQWATRRRVHPRASLGRPPRPAPSRTSPPGPAPDRHSLPDSLPERQPPRDGACGLGPASTPPSSSIAPTSSAPLSASRQTRLTAVHCTKPSAQVAAPRASALATISTSSTVAESATSASPGGRNTFPSQLAKHRLSSLPTGRRSAMPSPPANSYIWRIPQAS